LQEPTLIPIKKYAAMQRLSIFSVVKKIKNGELKSVTDEADIAKIFVIVDEAASEETSLPQAECALEETDWKSAYTSLRRDFEALRNEFETLKTKIQMGRVVL